MVFALSPERRWHASAPGGDAQRGLEGAYAASMQIIDWAMQLAPFGVACLVFAMAARLGGEVFVTLAWFLGTVLLGFALQLGVVYPLMLVAIGRCHPLTFFEPSRTRCYRVWHVQLERDVARIAPRRGTATASACGRLTVRAYRRGDGKSERNGAVRGRGGTVLAQVFGVDLSLGQQFMVVLLAVLAGVGTAGVPGGSIPMIILVLQSIGVPGESIAIVLGIDRILDMCGTTLNVTGDLAIAACVAGAEGAGQRRSHSRRSRMFTSGHSLPHVLADSRDRVGGAG